VFADQPGLVARHVLVAHIANALRRPVSNPHTDSGKASRQTPFRRQVTVRPAAVASISSAAIDLLSGMCGCRGRPRPEMGKINATLAG
jgi:hypothetical protein